MLLGKVDRDNKNTLSSEMTLVLDKMRLSTQVTSRYYFLLLLFDVMYTDITSRSVVTPMAKIFRCFNVMYRWRN